MSKFVSTKTFKNYPIAYRQWRADSHCNKTHGWGLSFYLEFESDTVDVRNWVVDFGSLRTLKEFLDDHFDHTLLAAQDDPGLPLYQQMHKEKMCKLVVVERTGCEGLSKFLYDYVNEIWLPDNGYRGVHCRLVKVSENDINSAWYEG